MKKYLLILVILTGGTPAMASYVNTCILKGVIVSEPKMDHSGAWTFDFKVEMSGKELNGRSDGSCNSNGSVISVTLYQKETKIDVKQGKIIWLRDLQKDNGVKSMRMFSLLTEADGEKSIEK